ncbi:MAG: HAD-IA family hydrolase [bacterium]
MKNKFTTLIFDFDGTLVDTASDVIDSINFALGEIGINSVSKTHIKKCIGPGKDDFLKAVLGKEFQRYEEEFIVLFRGYYWEHCLDNTLLFTGIADILQKYQHKNVTVASNKPRFFIERILEGLSILDLFDVIIGAEDVSQVKPHPEMVEKILEQTESLKAEILFIGDTDNDIIAGHKAGVSTCGVSYGYGDRFSIEEQNPHFMVDHPADLSKIIDNN